MRERMSPRAVLRRIRAQLPDTLMALQQVPQLFQAAVRDAAQTRPPYSVENSAAAQLRDEIRRGNFRRDAVITAAVLWLSGLFWLAQSTRIEWLGWLLLSAAVVLLVGSRYGRFRGR
jgi:hypothetical protein